MILYILKGEKEMIQKLRSKKGFTLMEMLIVVAIIAILIAIAIPTFASQLEKANQATDAANIRAAYAEAAINALDATDGTGTATTPAMKSNKLDKMDATTTIGGKTLAEIVTESNKAKGEKITVTVNVANDGKQTVTFTSVK